MKENNIKYENSIAPIIRVIIKNKIEVISNKTYPKEITFKNILESEELNSDIPYTFMNNPIDINKPIIELVPKNKDILTEVELIIETDTLDLNTNQKEVSYYKILRPFDKPFRILCFSPIDNNISIKKFPYQTLSYFGLDNFSCSKSSYCNTPFDLYISGGRGISELEGEGKNFFKINNMKISIEKLEDLPLEKEYHSMIYIPPKYIYFIGGNNRATFYYDLINKSFTMWSPLKQNKKYPALILVNNSVIYAFGSQKKLTDTDFIEKTNIKKKPKWEVVNVKISEPFSLRKFGAVLSNDDKIYFVGGRKERDDRVFYFDLKTNEIDKTNQINTAIKIHEPNFYNLNEYSSVLIPQETKGDVRIIIFNRRTKKFRKARYEKDYDLVSQKEVLEAVSNNPDDTPPKAEINIKKIENDYNNEFKIPQEEEFNMPSLESIKKILLGKKNILNKNVEAMVFNRKRIKVKKSDKIDGEESEEEYKNNSDDFNDNEENEKDDFSNDNIDFTNNKSIILRGKQNKNKNNIMTLKDICDCDENKLIFLNNIKKHKINNSDLSYISSGIINGNKSLLDSSKFSVPNLTGNIEGPKVYVNLEGNINTPNIDLKNNIDSQLNVNNPNIIEGPQINGEIKLPSTVTIDQNDINLPTYNINSNSNLNIPDININSNSNIKVPDININSNIKVPDININEDKKPKIKRYVTPDIDVNINNNNISGKISEINEELQIPNISSNIKSDIKFSYKDPFNTDTVVSEGITTIIGENKIPMKNDILTLKELFDGDVNDEINLNRNKVIVPGQKTTSISGVIPGIKNDGDININIPNIDLDINKPNINANIKGDIPGLNINMNGPKINMNDDFNVYTLKDICSEDVNNNI